MKRCFHSFLTVFLVHTIFASGHVYYIRTSQNISCPQQPCFTLSELAASSNLSRTTNTTLLFLPGKHHLNHELVVSDANYISVTKLGGSVFVRCVSQSGRFKISRTTTVSIKGLHFMGCGGNLVTEVNRLTIEDTIFQGMEGSGTALVLNGTVEANIVTCSYFCNTIGSTIQVDLPILVDLSETRTAGGAIIATKSNALIHNTTFEGNSAHLGTSIYVGKGSNVLINNSQFFNEMSTSGSGFGVLFVDQDCSVQVSNSMFSNNMAGYGVISSFGGTVVINNDTIFMSNTALISGGAVFIYNGSLNVDHSTFLNNTAGNGGGVVRVYGGLCFITDSTFSSNMAHSGGVIYYYSLALEHLLPNSTSGDTDTAVGSFYIANSTFSHNAAEVGGVIYTISSSVCIAGSSFVNNGAGTVGGVIFTSKGSVNITDCNFSNSTARNGGVMYTFGGSVHIAGSTYTTNSATLAGGVMHTSNSSVCIAGSSFVNNGAGIVGGVMVTSEGSVNITDCNFSNSTARNGGVMYTSEGIFLIANSTFSGSTSRLGGIVHSFNSRITSIDSNFEKTISSTVGAMYLFLTSVDFSGNTTFVDNLGSLYIFSCNITFNGYTRFENGMEPSDDAFVPFAQEEGGAITSILSNIRLAGTSYMINNHGTYGGAILAIESTISIYGNTVITNNTARADGGGLSLRQSLLEIKRVQLNCYISHNNATRGGGIYAIGSTVIVNQPGILHLVDNGATDHGGGFYLTGYSKVNLLKITNDNQICSGLTFTGNHATLGGAVYINDYSNSGACTTNNTDCFIQSLSLHLQYGSRANVLNIYFSENTATEDGSNIYGGLLNRCTVSEVAPMTDILYSGVAYSGVAYIENISNITQDSIASLPMHVCFCNDEGQPDCNYQPPTIEVKKGERFTVSLVAVDQVKHPVEATINSFLSSFEGGFDEGQQLQGVRRSCTDLAFNVVSPESHETLNLFPEGPCGNAELTVRHVNITFTDCTCPIGFEPSNNSPTRCECVCDSELDPHITICNESTSSLLRVDTNSWITYINDTDRPGYVIDPVCPFDYCHPPTEKNISLNLNLPNGSDAQCTYNRTGVLCGACQQKLSLSLGSSLCLRCEPHWPAVFVAIVLGAMIAGILLVTALLALNLTVAGGQINSFIFYANIVAATNSAFFSFSKEYKPGFPTVFIAWLNLDIGFDVCFIDGLDAYAKTWLQLAFPVYLISLVILVIVISEYSPRFARLIGKRDPVATLATLLLLSYAKLLSTIIQVYSFSTLEYPDETSINVWLPDGNVELYEGKCIILMIVAFIIIIPGFLYTILLLFWQWLVQTPRWRVFKWTRNTKLNAFITTYHVPYNKRYRYWTGLLLVVRVILYITAAFTTADNPQVPLLMIIILVGGLFVLKEVMGIRLYRRLSLDIIETVMYFNILSFTAFSLYDFGSGNSTKQVAAAYISTTIAFVLLVGVVFYHVLLLFGKKSPEKTTQPIPAPDNPQHAQVTFTSVEIPCR